MKGRNLEMERQLSQSFAISICSYHEVTVYLNLKVVSLHDVLLLNRNFLWKFYLKIFYFYWKHMSAFNIFLFKQINRFQSLYPMQTLKENLSKCKVYSFNQMQPFFRHIIQQTKSHFMPPLHDDKCKRNKWQTGLKKNGKNYTLPIFVFCLFTFILVLFSNVNICKPAEYFMTLISKFFPISNISHSNKLLWRFPCKLYDFLGNFLK